MIDRGMVAQIRRKLRRTLSGGAPARAHPEWRRVQSYLRRSERIVDLGCEPNPHPRASVGVDAFIDPEHRTCGMGEEISPDEMNRRGIEFVKADLVELPFPDKAFDFAYAHHVFEHLEDPKRACSEVSRIAKAGAIITPSPFAEIAFGRPYHLWLVLCRGETLIFIRKGGEENQPFGPHPEALTDGGYRVTAETNPFDVALNDGDWYQGPERFPRLSNLLRRHWYSHSSIMETVFIWEDRFDSVVIEGDGRVM